VMPHFFPGRPGRHPGTPGASIRAADVDNGEHPSPQQVVQGMFLGGPMGAWWHKTCRMVSREAGRASHGRAAALEGHENGVHHVAVHAPDVAGASVRVLDHANRARIHAGAVHTVCPHGGSLARRVARRLRLPRAIALLAARGWPAGEHTKVRRIRRRAAVGLSPWRPAVGGVARRRVSRARALRGCVLRHGSRLRAAVSLPCISSGSSSMAT
jgi:hypothetical protein